MERLRLEKEQLLEDEMKMRENLEERHKEQEKLLEEVSMIVIKLGKNSTLFADFSYWSS